MGLIEDILELYQRLLEFDAGLTKKAIDYFGTTNNKNVCGYIMPDGTCLDLSGKNQGSDGENRSLDHREVNALAFKHDSSETTRAMWTFMYRTGAVRVGPEGPVLFFVMPPTDRQKRKIISFFGGRGIYLEVRLGGGGGYSLDFDKLYLDDLERFIKNAFDKDHF